MTRNKLTDLNDHLFAQLERLNDEELMGEALTVECERSKAISQVAQNIILNAKLSLDAARLSVEYGHVKVNIPPMLENKDAER